MGKMAAVRGSLLRTHVGGAEATIPHITQKLIDVNEWDALSALWHRGGHMPLLAYVGENPYRTDSALLRREYAQEDRGWGPGSAARSRLMTRQGKGKRPTQHIRDGGAASTSGAAAPTAQAAAPVATTTSTTTTQQRGVIMWRGRPSWYNPATQRWMYQFQDAWYSW